MRLLLFVATLLSCLAWLTSCETDDPQPDETGAEQHTEQRRAPPEPPDTSSVRASEDDGRNVQASPATGVPSGLPIVATDPDEYDFLQYDTIEDGPYGFRTVLAIFSSTDHVDYDLVGVELVCDSQVEGGLLWIYAAAFPSFDGHHRGIAAPLDQNSGFPASVVFTRSTDHSDVYIEFDTVEPDSAQLFDGREFLAVARGYETALVRLPFAEDYITAEIDLRGVFNTPIQPNLDWCGAY